jgi:hypothetical protein
MGSVLGSGSFWIRCWSWLKGLKSEVRESTGLGNSVEVYGIAWIEDFVECVDAAPMPPLN